MSEQREVNDLSEEDIKAFEEAVDGKTEEKSEEKTEETATKEESKEVKAESSTAPLEEEEPKAEIKEVDGETPKERALRLELTRLRRKQREREQESLLKTPEPEISNDDEELKNLGYDEEQIKGLKKVVDVIASRQGYVKKDSTYREMANETLNNFIDEHPEYAPENDKDDVYWNRFNAILKSDYNLAGKNSKQLNAIFRKVDRDVKEELGEVKSDQGKIEAQKQKVQSVSHSTSASTPEPKAKSVLSAGNKTFVSGNHPGLVFKGFEEDEIDDILK